MKLFYTIMLFAVGAVFPACAWAGNICSDAIFLDQLSAFCSETGEYSLENKEFSGLENPSCFPQRSGEKDIWFRFVPKYENISIIIRGHNYLEPGNTLLEPQMALYKGDCDDPELIGCISDNQAQNFVELIIGDLELGASYFIRVSSRRNHSGSFQLCLDNFQFDPDYSSDCIDATVLCDKSPITVDIVSGVGKYPDEARNTCLDTDPRTGRKDGPSEYASVWFKWIAKDDGILTFTLDPLNPVDDLDFALFELPGGLQDCDRKIPIRCMASGENVGAPLDEWIMCTGATGLREGETHTSEERGCQPGNTNFLAPLEMEKGKAYALMVNNFSQSGHGFRLTWGGDGEFAGPDAEMFFLDEKPIYCAGEEIKFYAEDKSISGKITDYKWIYSDKGTSEELSGSGLHKIDFSSGGTKPIILHLESDIGCVTYLDTVIEVEDPIEIFPTIDSISCNGYGDGRIEVEVNSPSPVETIYWKNGQAGSVIDHLDPGSYTVFVRNELGCMQSDTFQLEEPLPIRVDAMTTIAGCDGGREGSIEVAGRGSYAPFQFDFADGRGFTDEAVRENLSAGSYDVTVRDAVGCERDTTIFVHERKYDVNGLEIDEPDCFGGSDGEVLIELTGGTKPYLYDLNLTGDFVTDNYFENLSAGDYVIGIMDADHCLGFHSFTLGEPDSMVIEVEYTSINCYGDQDGGLSVEVSGGTPGYEYQWSNGERNSQISDVGEGEYMVLITDANNCIVEESFYLEEPPELELILEDKMDLLCYGDQSGMIALSSHGGTGTHQYSFQDGEFSFTPRYNRLAAGNYNVVVRDENHCESFLEVELLQPEEVRVQIVGIQDSISTSINLGEKLDLEGIYFPPDRIMTWEWEPSDIFDCATCQATQVQPVGKTEIRLRGTDQDGCWGEDVFLMNVVPVRSVGIPNAVRKNTDGRNGYLTVYAGPHVAEIKELNVFDRWGNLLYSRKGLEPNDYQNGWDGTAEGKSLIPGIYAYMAEILYLDGVLKTFSGEVLLID